MSRLRNAVADVLVGVVLVLVAFWLLRGVFRMVIWAATLILFVLIIAVVLRIAAKIRG
jgi:hypothetical protein